MCEPVEIPQPEKPPEPPRWTPPEGNRVDVGFPEDPPENGGRDD